MKLSVFGQGKLGKPIADVLAKHFDVARVDPALGLHEDFTDADAHVIIVPTPSDQSGRFIDDYVRTVLSKLEQVDNDSPAILMSTVMPGTCRKLQTDFPRHPIVYSPQFVDLGHVAEKFERPDFVLVGTALDGKAAIYKRVVAMYNTVLHGYTVANMHSMSWESAEIAKLALNNFLALKLDFVNLVQGWCMENDVDYEPVFKVLQAEPRIGKQFMSPGFGHGGPCLTRDQRALAAISDVNIRTARKAFTKRLADQCGSRTVILGHTYKPHVPVIEDSHVMELLDVLGSRGQLWGVYDPLTSASGMSLEATIEGADTIVIGVPYKQFDIDYGDRKVINPWGENAWVE